MIMHFQTWDNGKYGQIWAVDDDNYSWKFTEIVNGCASEEDFQNSPVIASHFIGYCINNEPKGDGDIYTPFFTYYYKVCLEKFRKKHIDDIELVRDQKRLEQLFLNEHFEEERHAFEDSEVLFEFDSSKEKILPLLYYAYRDFLREKMPRYFVFREKLIPEVFPWREFDKIVMMGHAYTEVFLNNVLDLSLGRVFASDIINGRYIPEAEDMEQIKAAYGDSAKPCEVNYIRFNTSDKRKMAEAIYDAFRIDMEQRQFISPKEEELVMEHAERWIKSIPMDSEKSRDFKTIKRQLQLCLQRIDDDNLEEHTPFYPMEKYKLDDTDIKLEGCNRYGYAVEHQYRLNDYDFKKMMEAFDRWALVHYGNEISIDGKETTFKPLSDVFNAYMFGLYSSMCDEKIIENIDFVDFVKFISLAHFGSMFTVARANRNQNKLFLIVKHMKTWFSEEWAEKVAFSMGTTVERIDKVSPNEIRKSNKEWVDSLDKICPKCHSMQ